MLAPARWWIFTLVFAAGTALGAGAVALALQSLGMDHSLFLAADETNGPLAQATDQFRRYGLWFLAGMAMLPWTPRLTVVACALLGFGPLALLAVVFTARLVPCTALALIGAYGLPLAARVPLIGRIRDRIGAAIGARG